MIAVRRVPPNQVPVQSTTPTPYRPENIQLFNTQIRTYINQVITNRPMGITFEVAHNNFITALGQNRQIPENDRGTLTEIFNIFNGLRNNRIQFNREREDATAQDIEITEFLKRNDIITLQENYRTSVRRLEGLLPREVIGNLIPHADGPIHTIRGPQN